MRLTSKDPVIWLPILYITIWAMVKAEKVNPTVAIYGTIELNKSSLLSKA